MDKEEIDLLEDVLRIMQKLNIKIHYEDDVNEYLEIYGGIE